MNPREFNTIEHIPGNLVIKSSGKVDKLKKEYDWLSNAEIKHVLAGNIPKAVSFTAASGVGRLFMEDIYGDNIGDAFINIPTSIDWAIIAKQIHDIINKMSAVIKPISAAVDIVDLYKLKSNNRIWTALNVNLVDTIELDDADVIEINGKKYKTILSIINSPEYNNEIEHLIASYRPTLWHGDLHLGNMLLSSVDNNIKLIDPKGGIVGDIRYDIAKLRHTTNGQYLYVINDMLKVTHKDSSYTITYLSKYNRALRNTLLSDLDNIFSKELDSVGYNTFDIKFIEALLFATMIPCHTDSKDRQLAFYLIATMKFNEVLYGPL